MPDDRPSPWSVRPGAGAEARGHAGWSAPAYGAPMPPPPAWAAPQAGYADGLAAPGHPAAAYAGPPVEVRVTTAPASGRGLAVAGVVLGSLALLGVALMAVVLFVFVSGEDGQGGGGGYGPMRGTIAPTGHGLTGQALAAAVAGTVRDDGGEPEGITCPATPKVAQDVTTVCHGTDLGEDSAFVVFFEDATGSYTLLEL